MALRRWVMFRDNVMVSKRLAPITLCCNAIFQKIGDLNFIATKA
jgi:hypothetical protein